MSTTTTVVEVRYMTVDLSIKNAEDRVFRGCIYAPSSATINYSDLIAPYGEVRGPVRNKDGNLGVAWVSEYWRYGDAPEWLKAAVDAERPEWARR